MANKDISKYARSKRNISPHYIEKRVEMMRRLTRAHLKAAGAPSGTELGEAVGSSASSTLDTHIRKGTLTMKEMVQISVKYTVDWSAIIAAVAADVREFETEEELFDKDDSKGQAKKKQGYQMKSSQEDREAFLALLRNGGEAQTQWSV